MKITSNEKGVTLIELIIVVAIMGFLMAAAWPMMHFSRTAEQAVLDEYRIQADMRVASEQMTQFMRHATIGFTVTKTQLNSGPKRDRWSYFVLENDKRTITHYRWMQNAAGVFTHVPEVIVEGQEGVVYNLTFKQPQPGTKMMEFTLEGVLNGKSESKITITSQVVALNSVAIDDAGTEADPAIALAYRSEPAPTPQNLSVAVAMVLDDSGSMREDMGGSGPNWDDTRNPIMVTQANALIDKFATMGYVEVCIIPFANSATPKPILNAKTSTGVLKGYINALNGDGATNTGDGMRRAYYALSSYNTTYLAAHPGSRVLNYMILLTDGNPTLYNQKYHDNGWWSRSWYSLPGGYLTELNVTTPDDDWETRGTGNSDPSGLCLDYTERIGRNLIVNGGLDIKTIGIGFTGKTDEVDRVRAIATDYCETVPRNPSNLKGSYYDAGSSAELEAVFTSIKDMILSEVWHIYGPY